MSAELTPTRSWMRLHPRRTSSVLVSVVLRRLRVMFTTTTLDDMAMERPIMAAPAGAMPSARQARALATQVTMTLDSPLNLGISVTAPALKLESRVPSSFSRARRLRVWPFIEVK